MQVLYDRNTQALRSRYVAGEVRLRTERLNEKSHGHRRDPGRNQACSGTQHGPPYLGWRVRVITIEKNHECGNIVLADQQLPSS
jgi:hypothetical protein